MPQIVLMAPLTQVMFNHDFSCVILHILLKNSLLKTNGGFKIDISNFKFIYNMPHDYTEGADALKRRQNRR